MEAFLFALLAIVALTELGVTAYLVNYYDRLGYLSWRYRSVIILLLFNSVWTSVFGLAYVCFIASGALNRLARLTASVTWLFITAILWGVAAGLYTSYRDGGWWCWNSPALWFCRRTQAAEGLAWTAFALCIVTMLASFLTWHHKRNTDATVSDSMIAPSGRILNVRPFTA